MFFRFLEIVFVLRIVIYFSQGQYKKCVLQKDLENREKWVLERYIIVVVTFRFSEDLEILVIQRRVIFVLGFKMF